MLRRTRVCVNRLNCKVHKKTQARDLCPRVCRRLGDSRLAGEDGLTWTRYGTGRDGVCRSAGGRSYDF
jgi:hypothetical protein